ncbi:TetR/AcrR family transcriptional regulator [Actinomadura harenae]|uniref:TetR/AcrR family transcriptional regulator n=1 Tax=Actinomadura harenae TaxID=2483351 RepID=A0A3M2M2M2_9ACTN|nr:TetR/AcrR family transcriptional regulator [Actinomadura harenae]RMI43350.1 TetR/AcrR family transcriptional regulator [Actinomadura harenae]
MPRKTDPISDSVWMRPERPRRGRPQLSRGEIVTAAVALLDAEGLEGFSMRRLGAALGAGATSLYFYVDGKNELLDLAMDEIMGEVPLPGPEVRWREAAAGFVREMRRMLVRHPWVIGLFGTRLTIGPNSLRFSDRFIEVFLSAGFSGQAVSWASSVLMSHAVGSAAGQASYQRATEGLGLEHEELLERFDPFVVEQAERYPAYARWWLENRDQMAGWDGPEEGAEFGAQRILDGLELWLHREHLEAVSPARPKRATGGDAASDAASDTASDTASDADADVNADAVSGQRPADR